jgi:hypothetical protein
MTECPSSFEVVAGRSQKTKDWTIDNVGAAGIAGLLSQTH